jgi:hypothetical protein
MRQPTRRVTARYSQMLQLMRAAIDRLRHAARMVAMRFEGSRIGCASLRVWALHRIR